MYHRLRGRAIDDGKLFGLPQTQPQDGLRGADGALDVFPGASDGTYVAQSGPQRIGVLLFAEPPPPLNVLFSTPAAVKASCQWERSACSQSYLRTRGVPRTSEDMYYCRDPDPPKKLVVASTIHSSIEGQRKRNHPLFPHTATAVFRRETTKVQSR